MTKIGQDVRNPGYANVILYYGVKVKLVKENSNTLYCGTVEC